MRLKRAIDISMAISGGMAVWPGDKGVMLARDCSIQEGAGANVSCMAMSVHTGTHVDIPLHFIEGAPDISTLDVNQFAGNAKVFHMDVENCITAADLAFLPIEDGDILLFKTRNSHIPEGSSFRKEYVHIDYSAANYLADKKVKAIGVDYLSVEPYEAEGNPVHKLLLSKGIILIEGLRLDHVQTGEYFVCFFPLKLVGSEGSPVRAVLFEFDD